MNYWLMNLHPTDERRTDAEIRSYVSSRVIGMGEISVHLKKVILKMRCKSEMWFLF